MRNRWLALAVVLLALACKRTETTNETTAVATDTTDTSTTASSTLSDADKDFMTKAAIGGMAEVSMGSLAAQQASNADVKAFGNRMVTDHGKANDELKAFAATKGVTLPADVDAEHKAKQDELAKKTGKAFDKAYIDDMVEDHEKDVAEFEKQSTAAQDPDLKAWVSKTLPTLQDHLKMAKDTQAKVK